MPLQADSLAYESPWRPNYEMQAVAGWVCAAITALTVCSLSTMPAEPFYWISVICAVMILIRLPKAVQLYRSQKSLRGHGLSFLSLQALKKRMTKHPNTLWLGYGFVWENRHVQRVFEILKRDWQAITPYISKRPADQPIGQPWIHGVEPKETEQYQSLTHLEGHTLILGTTGSGKTRFFDLLIAQAIFREEAVIIIDPKGDKEMRDNARRACEAIGHPERFVAFHPAFPEESVRLDPLRNFTRVTELASRLAALIPSEAGADPFKSFAWQALNNIAQGLVMICERPNLILLRRYLEGGSASLVSRAVQAYSARVLPHWEAKAKPYLDKAQAGSRERRATAMLRFYYDEVQPEHANADLEGLLSMFQHDTTHFAKMVASLLPVMNMLTSGELGKLLSPNANDLGDKRPMTDMAKIINNGQAAYLGLDCLTDSMVGSAIGSIAVSDLTAVAGDRYNYGVNNRRVNIFIDETVEILNEPVIQSLNKGRGAGFNLAIAAQTCADFPARLGSEHKARQVLGNINNQFVLRVIDSETQKYVVDSLPKTRIKHVMRTQGQTTLGETPWLYGGNQGERLIEEEADLFPAPLLGMLPNLEYIAKISGGKIIKGRFPVLTQ